MKSQTKMTVLFIALAILPLSFAQADQNSGAKSNSQVSRSDIQISSGAVADLTKIVNVITVKDSEAVDNIRVFAVNRGVINPFGGHDDLEAAIQIPYVDKNNPGQIDYRIFELSPDRFSFINSAELDGSGNLVIHATWTADSCGDPQDMDIKVKIKDAGGSLSENSISYELIEGAMH